jgi:outer membrane protein
LSHLSADEKQRGGKIAIEADKVYDLPELIDIAEHNNPQTEAAWERARQAAQAVGLTEASYYPYLVASAAAGYERAFLPFPTLKVGPNLSSVSIVGGGTLTADAAAEGVALNLKWLLFDFGERKATKMAAQERLMMANVGFNAVHQLIVFDVTRRFYALDAVRQKVAVAESSLSAAKTVAEAASARLTNGLATKPETLQAEQLTAQASFDLEAVRGELSDARVALMESLGVLPTDQLQVAEVPDQSPANNYDVPLDSLLDRALSQRPDLVLALASVRARRAEVKQAHAAYYPKIALGGNVGYSELDVSVANSGYFGGNEPVYGVGLTAELPIFDGFLRAKKLRIAESELRSAESELAASRDKVVREVWKAYTDFKTALNKEESAAKLVAAAQSAFDASLDAYHHGLGGYVEVVNAQRNLTAAHSIMVDTRAAILTGDTALALTIGDLARPSSKPVHAHSP